MAASRLAAVSGEGIRVPREERGVGGAVIHVPFGINLGGSRRGNGLLAGGSCRGKRVWVRG